MIAPGHRTRIVAIAASVTLILFVAVADRRSLAGTLAAFALAGLAGIAIVEAWRRVRGRARLPDAAARTAAPALVLLAAWAVFLHSSAPELDANHGDWAIHIYLVDGLVEALDAGRGVPAWVHGLSSGDAPHELYPAAIHLVTAELVRLLDARGSVASVVFFVGLAGYVLLAIGVARLARRIAPWPIAAAAGTVALLDAGSIFSGGAIASLYYALLAQTTALCAALFGAIAAADVMERGRWTAAVRTWLFFALAACAHPTGLVVAAAACFGCIVVAAVARDVRATRALLAALHVAIGVLGAAFVWAPYGARILDWGGSYGTPGTEAARALQEFFFGDFPNSAFPLLFAGGYVGVLVGLFSRRAIPTFVSVVATVLTLGSTDVPFLLSGVVPSAETGRLAASRMVALAKPFVLAALAYVLGLAISSARSRARQLPGYTRASIAALAGISALLALRAVVPFTADRLWEVRETMHAELEDPDGFEALVAWARARAEESEGRFGRMFFETPEHYPQRIGTETGIPVFHGYVVPMAFLRHRMDDVRPESLRRFGVRWVVRRGRAPVSGDPATQAQLGTYFVRTVPEWDGSFAHLERGAGRVRVTELENERVVVELEGTDAPALVSFAMGFYPRWRAQSEGRAIPLYGMRASETSESRVVAAWLPPGRTVLTADAALPSDGRGRGASILGAVLAMGFLIGVFVPTVRFRVRASTVRAVRVLRARRVTPLAVAVAAIVVLALALGSDDDAAGAVLLFDGGRALVEAKGEEEGDEWTPCAPKAWLGYADCGPIGRVTDTMGALIRPEPFSWPWATPAIAITPREKVTHYRITMARTLAGTYEAAAQGDRPTVSLRVDGGPGIVLTQSPRRIELGPAPGRHILELEIDLPTPKPASIALLRTEPIAREQTIPEPPATPPGQLGSVPVSLD